MTSSIYIKLPKLPAAAVAFANALMAAVPLLTEHWPEGMVDFQEDLPLAWRGGLTVRPARTNQIPVDQEGRYYFKALFASEASRNLATFQIGTMLTACLMGTDWPSQSNAGDCGRMHQLTFSILEKAMPELTTAIAPAPARERARWPPRATRQAMEQKIPDAFRGRDTPPIDDHLL